MKTIEEKAKAYDEALEKAKKLYEKGTITESLNYVFPELAESEDEKIRKWLEEHIEAMPDNSIEFKDVKRIDVLHWLEKQGNQKPQGKSALEAIKEEKVDNQNCVKPSDKVEPKFHEGEWIVLQDKCCKVNYNGCGYELIDQMGLRTSLEYGTVDENAHIWNIIKDAEDGDVLYSLDSNQPFIYKERNIHEQATAYCGINKYGKFFVWNTKDCIITLDKYIPATKEQRDTLMNAMTKAGWQFNFDKKELKKIEQSSAWSEEDEKNLKRAILYIENPALNVIKDIMLSEWLKSLKERINN